MKFNRTKFQVTIAGETYKFACLTQKQMEQFTATENKAREIEDQVERLKSLQKVYDTIIVEALNAANDEQITVEDLKEADAPTVTTLLKAILGALGMTLDAKTGELGASSIS